MCTFLSAVKTKSKGEDKWYFLTHHLIHNTPRGELIQKQFPGSDELIGHAAIRAYFQLRDGKCENWECSDFSTPDNFPAVIVKAIKRGNFRGFGTPKGLLSQPAAAEYEKATQQAWAEYKKATQQAWAEYEKATQLAAAECLKAFQQAWAEYEKAKEPAFWDLFASPENRNPAWKEG